MFPVTPALWDARRRPSHPAAAAEPANYERRASPRSSRRCCPCRPRGRAAVAPRLGHFGPQGLTGHLDEYHTTFGDAWKGFAIKAPMRNLTAPAAPGTVRLLVRRRMRLDWSCTTSPDKKIRARLDPIVDSVNRRLRHNIQLLEEEGLQARGLQ